MCICDTSSRSGGSKQWVNNPHPSSRFSKKQSLSRIEWREIDQDPQGYPLASAYVCTKHHILYDTQTHTQKKNPQHTSKNIRAGHFYKLLCAFLKCIYRSHWGNEKFCSGKSFLEYRTVWMALSSTICIWHKLMRTAGKEVSRHNPLSQFYLQL